MEAAIGRLFVSVESLGDFQKLAVHNTDIASARAHLRQRVHRRVLVTIFSASKAEGLCR
jgi:hypothetical protein